MTEKMPFEFQQPTPDNREKLIQEVVRGAEKFLDGQVNLATSADRRAASMIAVFSAAATGISAATVGGLLSEKVGLGSPTFIAGSAIALMFVVGGALCWLSSKPVGIHLPGSTPDGWKRDLQENKPLAEAQFILAGHYQGYIKHNELVLERNSKLYRSGSLIGVAAPLVGAMIWLLASLEFCQWSPG